jgi:hypothetical protein
VGGDVEVEKETITIEKHWELNGVPVDIKSYGITFREEEPNELDYVDNNK